MKAALLVPRDPKYPYMALKHGLERIGYEIGSQENSDILVTWTPWKRSVREIWADRFRASGRKVIVCENGWLSPLQDQKYFQLALDSWNGEGSFPSGDASRWKSWGLYPKQWKKTGEHVLVIGQKGHPEDFRAPLPGWHEQIDVFSDLPVVRRSKGDKTPLDEQLKLARECHVWSSSVAHQALMMGVPVIQHGPTLMGQELTSKPGEPLKYGTGRRAEFERLAWAQWTAEEISTGEPLKRLI